MTPDTPARETIIVVHGTFAGNPSGPGPAWYAPGGSFCNALDAELAARQSKARCWAHLQPNEEHFRWDGANEWLSRLKAGERLQQQIKRLQADGWLVHLVAHSHGGNVVLNAVTDRDHEAEPWFAGRGALLGTPIYRAARDSGRRARLWRVVSFAAWAMVLYASARHLDFAAAFQVGGPAETWAIAAAVVLLFVTPVLVIRASRYLQLVLQEPLDWEGPMRRSPAFLVINSEYDEAYRALAGLPNAPNPLLREAPSTEQPPSASTASSVRAVAEAVRTRAATRITTTLDTTRPRPPLLVGFSLLVVLAFWQTITQRMLSAPLAAAWAPVVFLGVLVAGITAACFSPGSLMFPAIGVLETFGAVFGAASSMLLLTLDRVIRRFVWGTIKGLSLGLNGAADSADDVKVDLELSHQHSIYLELPQDLVAGVQADQAKHGNEIHELVYRPGLVWSPLSLVKELAKIDFPLVHTSYYGTGECIQKVAEWICEPLEKHFDGCVKTPITQIVRRGHDGVHGVIPGEIEGRNRYEDHVDDLKLKFGPVKTRWGTKTRLVGAPRHPIDRSTEPTEEPSRPRSPWLRPPSSIERPPVPPNTTPPDQDS
jgi:hypothetical protein